MAFAENLKYLMDVKGYSNYKLAKELGCHQTTVQNWLDGSIPQKRTQKNIAEVFGISVEELMGNSIPTPKKEKAPPTEGELSEREWRLIKRLRQFPEERLDSLYKFLDSEEK